MGCRLQEGEAANAANLSTRVGELERELAASKRISRQAETEKKVKNVLLYIITYMCLQRDVIS